MTDRRHRHTRHGRGRRPNGDGSGRRRGRGRRDPRARLRPPQPPHEGVALAPNAPDSYVVKHGDTLWGIAKVFLRDPWYWPEIWQVNPQVKNPHLIYPGDTLRLVYIDGRPRIVLQPGLERGNGARVLPRVRSQPLEAAVTTIPYETVAAFMSKPSVLEKEQIKHAPYVLATRDSHVVMADGDTVYARGFTAPVELGSHYNLVRVGEALRDPDDNRLLGYNGVYTGSGHVTRGGDPATLIMTDSTRETYPGDKLFPGDVDVPLDFIPSPPRTKINGRIMRGFGRRHRHRPVSGGRHQPRRSRRPGPRQRACRIRRGRHGAR